MNEALQLRQWKQTLAVYSGPDVQRSCTQLMLSLSLFCAAISLAYVGNALSWSFGLPLSAVSGFLIIRLFIIQHDCGHRSYFHQKWTCDLVGRGLSILTFMPYGFWRRDHDKHHATSGNLDRRGRGDIDTLTVEEFWALSSRRRFIYRVYRNPLVFMGIGPAWQFLIRYRFPIVPRGASRSIDVMSIVAHNTALLSFLGLQGLIFGWTAAAFVWVPAMLTAGTIGVWMFYVQHQYEDTYWRKQAEWSFVEAALQGSSYYRLPAWLHWLTGYIGYHHIHHLASRIPNYRLASAFKEIPELRQGATVSIRQSLRGLTLSLWCVRRGRLVSFREASFPV